MLLKSAPKKTNGAVQSCWRRLIEVGEITARLVRALRKEGHEDRQIRQREQPLVRAQTCRFRGARDKSQMTALRKIANMLDTNSRQARHFRIGEYFLARFYGNHVLGPRSLLQL
jgi:hypothetical protein